MSMYRALRGTPGYHRQTCHSAAAGPLQRGGPFFCAICCSAGAGTPSLPSAKLVRGYHIKLPIRCYCGPLEPIGLHFGSTNYRNSYFSNRSEARSTNSPSNLQMGCVHGGSRPLRMRTKRWEFSIPWCRLKESCTHVIYLFVLCSM